MTLKDLIPEFDTKPIDTDWININEMFKDIRRHHKETGEEIITADDPGYNHQPPRTPRIGFAAESKSWTIRLADLKNQTLEDEELKLALQSAAGRKALVEALQK